MTPPAVEKSFGPFIFTFLGTLWAIAFGTIGPEAVQGTTTPAAVGALVLSLVLGRQLRRSGGRAIHAVALILVGLPVLFGVAVGTQAVVEMFPTHPAAGWFLAFVAPFGVTTLGSFVAGSLAMVAFIVILHEPPRRPRDERGVVPEGDGAA